MGIGEPLELRPINVLDRLGLRAFEASVPINVQPSTGALRVLCGNFAVVSRKHHVQVQVILGVPHQGHCNLTLLGAHPLERLFQLMHQFALSLRPLLHHLRAQVLQIALSPTAATEDQREDAGEEEFEANGELAQPQAKPLWALMLLRMRQGVVTRHALAPDAFILATILLLQVGPSHSLVGEGRVAIEGGRLRKQVQARDEDGERRHHDEAAANAVQDLLP
mmetsp:Transcript_81005/g.234879  ORF Transcript_81005/g.234879 Transcript_81005/m.234879 type:complete len:222 (+) Transcript_81005:423-1088(+)